MDNSSELTLIILAAGVGKRLKPLTLNKPKFMVEVAGSSIAEWQLRVARSCGIHNIIIVSGFCSDAVQLKDCIIIRNPEYASTNMVQTLWYAEEYFGNNFIVSYGDIVYEPFVLRQLINSESPVSVVVDVDYWHYWQERQDNPFDDLETLKYDDNYFLTEIGKKTTFKSDIKAQYIGLTKFTGKGISHLRKAYETAKYVSETATNPFNCLNPFKQLYMTDLLQGMIEMKYTLTAVPIQGGWIEVDCIKDKELAEKFLCCDSELLPIIRRRKG